MRPDNMINKKTIMFYIGSGLVILIVTGGLLSLTTNLDLWWAFINTLYPNSLYAPAVYLGAIYVLFAIGFFMTILGGIMLLYRDEKIDEYEKK